MSDAGGPDCGDDRREICVIRGSLSSQMRVDTDGVDETVGHVRCLCERWGGRKGDHKPYQAQACCYVPEHYNLRVHQVWATHLLRWQFHYNCAEMPDNCGKVLPQAG